MVSLCLPLEKVAGMMYWRIAARCTTLRNMYDLHESQSLPGIIKNLYNLRIDTLLLVIIVCVVSKLWGLLFQRESIIVGNATGRISGTKKFVSLSSSRQISWTPGTSAPPHGMKCTMSILEERRVSQMSLVTRSIVGIFVLWKSQNLS